MEIALFTVVLILGLSVTTVVHELGHFLAAKATGVHVVAYNVGFGPAVFEKGGGEEGTRFRLCLVPLGAFAELLNEKQHKTLGDTTLLTFSAADPVRRLVVALGDPGGNFAFAFVLFVLVALSPQSDLDFLGRIAYPFAMLWGVLWGATVAGIQMILAQLSIVEFLGSLQLTHLGLEQTNLFTADARVGLTLTDYLAIWGAFSIIQGIINLLPGPVVDGSRIISAFLSIILRRHSLPDRTDTVLMSIGAVFGFGPLVLALTYLSFGLV